MKSHRGRRAFPSKMVAMQTYVYGQESDSGDVDKADYTYAQFLVYNKLNIHLINADGCSIYDSLQTEINNASL